MKMVNRFADWCNSHVSTCIIFAALAMVIFVVSVFFYNLGRSEKDGDNINLDTIVNFEVDGDNLYIYTIDGDEYLIVK